MNAASRLASDIDALLSWFVDGVVEQARADASRALGLDSQAAPIRRAGRPREAPTGRTAAVVEMLKTGAKFREVASHCGVTIGCVSRARKRWLPEQPRFRGRPRGSTHVANMIARTVAVPL